MHGLTCVRVRAPAGVWTDGRTDGRTAHPFAVHQAQLICLVPGSALPFATTYCLHCNMHTN